MIADLLRQSSGHDAETLKITPTDLSQFIRLDQCERFLRLRLHERQHGLGFMRDLGIVPQTLPPLLTESGSQFEAIVEKSLANAFPTRKFSGSQPGQVSNANDNDEVIAAASSLRPGEAIVLLQTRVVATLNGWLVRGAIDALRLERDAGGQLEILITDMKSSKTSRMEHRLQVAFYASMVERLLSDAGVAHEPIRLSILFRGEPNGVATQPEIESDKVAEQRNAARELFGVSEALLDLIPDALPYLEAVRDLITGPDSTARRLLATELEDIPFNLTWKCDSCIYNAWCMRQSAEADDLSLLPFMSEQDKRALKRNGIDSIRALAALKRLPPEKTGERQALLIQPGMEALCRRLSATWPVGPRLDELIHRALRYCKWMKDPVQALTYIPHKGYGSLPYSGPEQGPNLIRIYIDAQHDHLHDRINLLGALVVGCEDGVETDARRRAIVRITDGPPDSAGTEEALFVDWIGSMLHAMVEVAAPDANGEPRAPIHLVFHNALAQQQLLEGLARNAEAVLGATALYDFITQLAAFDSPIATVLETEIREQKNYPLTCQSLQAVAAYLRFDWNAPAPYRDIFNARLFDFWGRFDMPLEGEERPGRDGWYTRNARFSSSIPLEFAYAAWGELEPVPPGDSDELAPFRAATIDLLTGFQARRLEAIEHIAHDFAGNKQTTQRAFTLPDLADFEQKARTLAQALHEFSSIERHVALSAWNRARLAPPERRVLAGETLVVRYLEDDQDPGVADRNRENERRRVLREGYRRSFRAEHPEAAKVQLKKEQKTESDWSQTGMKFRLRLETAGIDCDLDEALALSTIKPGERLVLFPRYTVDSRLPFDQQVPFTPTPKQMLYGMRVELDRIVVELDEMERATAAFADVIVQANFGGNDPPGFTFGTIDNLPLVANQVYTLDSDPNDIYGKWSATVVGDLLRGAPNTLLAFLDRAARDDVPWFDRAAAAQQRFLNGLDALHAAGALHGFEESKRRFIGDYGDAPLLLVQGPPGTGKSYSTAFALFARMQAALADDREFRIAFGCKTHAATDVLLENVVKVRNLLEEWSGQLPELFATYFDARLLDLPIFRVRPRGDLPNGVIPLPNDNDRETGTTRAADRVASAAHCVVAATPGGLYQLVRQRWDKDPHGHDLVQCLVLDEASQINLPEAMMAAVPLGASGQLIIVGDHRQMPPIVRNDWSRESRRTFQEFRAFDSLFEALLPYEPPMIKFSESFRLHAEMAEFLRREIYAQDGIDYFSNRFDLLDPPSTAEPFVAAALSREHPMIVIVHDEEDSQVRNRFEQALLSPILRELTDPWGYALEPVEGIGVVVPHRAQRAALQDAFPERLTVRDPLTNAVTLSAVDTVERFQGGERTVILVGATESDREYLLTTSEFLLDPRRLTVALSRAKRKMILVASRSVFELFIADETTFGHAQLWKNLLRRTCTVPLWNGVLEGHAVEVWGNDSIR